MNSIASNFSCNVRIAAVERTVQRLENSVQRLVDSNEQLLEFLKQSLSQNNGAQKNTHSDADTSDGGENEMMTGTCNRRKYTPQEIIDMLCEDSEKQRCAHGACASKSNSAGNTGNTGSTSTTASSANSVASAPHTPSSASTAEKPYATEKKRKLDIKEYFTAQAPVNTNTENTTVDDPENSSATENFTGPCAYMRGGYKTAKYLTLRPYIRHRDEMQASAARVFVNKPPKPDENWWLAIKVHVSPGSDKELKGWYTSMQAAEKARDDWLAKHNFKLVINHLNTWQMVPTTW
jgi:hypothetical protein